MTARFSLVARWKPAGVALVWLLLFWVVGVGVTILLSAVVPAHGERGGGHTWWLARDGLEQAVGFAVATVVVGYRLDRHSWERMGWRFDRGLPLRALQGAGMGAALAGIAVGLACVAGGATLHLTPTLRAWPGVAAPLAVGLVAAALSEELAFRGYPLRRLAEAIGPVWAMVVIAVGFGCVHLANPNATLFSTANIVVAGVWLSVAFFSPGGMPLAWGLHLGWNGALSLLFDAPVSGWAFDVPGVDYAPGSRGWIDGGRFGPEGGLAATVALLVGTLLVLGHGTRSRPGWLTA